MRTEIDKQHKVYSVGEITRHIRFSLENRYSSVWIEGEISGFLHHTSGHMYFSLKDTDAVLKCVMFKQSNRQLHFKPEEGMKVLVHGRISLYAPRGQYQLTADAMEPKGVGDLQLAFEQLKRRLAEEGLFDEERKKPMPYLPRHIGVITSLTGAVIRDMMHVLDRRYPGYKLVIAPVQVQGESAKHEIVQALESFNEYGGVQVVVLARGGGSLEDLWAFNEEIVARAIAASQIPVMSAVGHEVDFTIADFVADLRAPTPSAAAELLLPEQELLKFNVQDLARRIAKAMQDQLKDKGQQLDESLLDLRQSLKGLLALSHERFRSVIGRLEALNPLACLVRGYSITTDSETKRAMTSTQELKIGQRLDTRFSRGSVVSRIEEIHHAKK